MTVSTIAGSTPQVHWTESEELVDAFCETPPEEQLRCAWRRELPWGVGITAKMRRDLIRDASRLKILAGGVGS